MSQNQSFIAELQHEATNTRKVLAKVPCEKNTWKPHDRSMAIGNLASHISELPGWVTMIVKTDGLDLAKMDYKPFIAETNADLVAHHDEKLTEAVAALENATDEDLKQNWTLSKGGHVMQSMSKASFIRNLYMNHMIHHRGQLTVYLRLLDIPVPGIYGPSADDRIAMAAASSN